MGGGGHKRGVWEGVRGVWESTGLKPAVVTCGLFSFCFSLVLFARSHAMKTLSGSVLGRGKRCCQGATRFRGESEQLNAHLQEFVFFFVCLFVCFPYCA